MRCVFCSCVLFLVLNLRKLNKINNARKNKKIEEKNNPTQIKNRKKPLFLYLRIEFVLIYSYVILHKMKNQIIEKRKWSIRISKQIKTALLSR